MNSASLIANVLVKPNADFTFHPTIVHTQSEPVQFFDRTDCHNCSLSWYFMPNNDTILINDPVYSFTEAGNHAVTLLVTTSNGCRDTVTKVVNVEDEINLYVPNAFTPDNDGLNDAFLPKGTGINSFTMDIFNRWGELIFSSSSITQGWNGNFRGKLCKQDSYTWKISVKTGSVVKTYTGVVNLLR
jgi:gliding motility-associated-like protein